MEEFSRVTDMKDAEIVRWAFVLARMAAIEARLSEMTQNQPDTALSDALHATRAELAHRTAEKGGLQR